MIKPVIKREKKGQGGPSKEVSQLFDAFKRLDSGEDVDEALFKKIKGLYEDLEDLDKEALYRNLTENMEVPAEDLKGLIQEAAAYDTEGSDWSRLLSELRNRIVSPRIHLFQKISRLPGGLKFLLDFRGDLLSIQRFSKAYLRPLDQEITALFDLWFQDGFLYLEEITLDSSYRQIELIKDSDLVHPMTNIEEMGQRLGKDRRCFALYHRLIPYEPIIFIEVAITRGIVKRIQDIIGEESEPSRDARVNTAIFYSINNTQNGLAGLGLGQVLIGQVVDYLRKDNNQIRNFATLSPVPGFWKRYLKPILEGEDERFKLKAEDVISYFSKKQVARIMREWGREGESQEQFNETLLSIFSNEDWPQSDTLCKCLRAPMVRIAYHYVSEERNPMNKLLNPVANFHISNGATVAQKNVNFLANPSSRGLGESCGIMVNYIYTSSWLSQIRRSFRLFDRFEVKGVFSKDRS